MSITLFGRKPRHSDPAWPAEARAIWSEAVWRYHVRFVPRETLTVEEVWDALALHAPNPEQWWLIPHFGWAELGNYFGIGDRNAAYRLEKQQGWRFVGKDSCRRITVAPCVQCGSPRPVDLIIARRCKECYESQNPRR